MKKLILTLLGILFLSAFSAFAESVKIDFTQSPIEITDGSNSSTVTKTDQQELGDVTLNDYLSLTSNGKWWTKKLRFYSNNTLEIVGEASVKITKIAVAYTYKAFVGNFKVKDGDATSYSNATNYTTTGTSGTYTWNAPDGSNIHSILFTNTGEQSRLNSITITYEITGPAVVDNPTISNEKGVVTLDCTTTGATIKYHVGDAAVEATECTEVYTEPFTVTKGQTVSVIATKDGANDSEVVSQVISWETLPCGDVTTNPVAVNEDITVERGTVITFSAENADALAFEVDGQAKEIVANPYEYTATADALVTVTPIQDGEEVTDKSAVFTIAIKAAEACGEVIFTPASGSEITTGSTITATAANAVKYEYAFNDRTSITVEGETLNITAPAEEGEYTLSVTPYNADNVAGTTATASYTVKLPTSASVNLVFSAAQSTGNMIGAKDAVNINKMLDTNSQSLVTSLSDAANLAGGASNNGSRAVRFGTLASGSYKVGTLTLNLASSYKITSIDVTLSTYKSNKGPANPTWNLDINGHTMAETLTADVTTATTYTISFETLSRAGVTAVNSLIIKSTDAPVDVYSLKINYEPTQTGIIDVTVSGEGEVEYFNLQGVRVANPESGLYIRRQGNQVSKVYLR